MCAREAGGDISEITLLFYITPAASSHTIRDNKACSTLQCSLRKCMSSGKQTAMTEELAVEAVDSRQAVNIPSHESVCRLRKHLEPSHRSNAAGSGYLRVPASYSTGCAAFRCGACAGRMEWCSLGAVVLTAGCDIEDTEGQVARGLLPMPQLTHDRLC